MTPDRVTEFSGTAGAVLRGALSGASLLSGIALGTLLIVGNVGLFFAQAPVVATPFTQIVVALALARFALNGRHGQWNGTIFSDAGGSWGEVFQVASRYLALTGIWLLPMLVLGMNPQEAMALGPMASGKVVSFAMIYMMAMMLTPPLFLIVAVGADSFGEIFSPQLWRRCFGGRLGDLFMIYVAYTGTLGMVLLLSIPPVLLAVNAHPIFGLLMAAVAFFLVLGLAVNLLGRLCGFFECGESGTLLPSQLPADPGSFNAADPPTQVAPEPTPAAPAAPPVPQSVPLSSAAPSSSASQPLSPPRAPAAVVATRNPPPVPLATAESVGDAVQEGLPPLLDAAHRIEAAMKRFNVDPEGCILDLRDLTRTFAPHPEVLHALTVCLHRSGHVDPAIEMARQALPLCIERGGVNLAAEIVKQLRPQLDRLEFDRELFLRVAAVLAQKDELACAAKVYSTVIAHDAGESRAIKGLLEVADGFLNRKGKPETAVKVYRYLLDRCSASPLAEYVIQGLQEAERKQAQAAPAASG